ncbi:MAG: transcriptional regulator [Chloroflexota bacterium]|nr:MAG: transcriptional regulator [Chloroflexota bacterium]
MRADRLLSMLMILQMRRKVTAQELAKELEVSVRTIYRDVNALSFSGVPVYAERGPGGGISLIESYRSDLTGLTKSEVQALFMLNIPPALTALGLDQELRAAMLKLSAALPSTLRGDEQRVRQRIHIDPAAWGREQSTPTHLQTLHRAVWESLELEITYQMMIRPDMGLVRSILLPCGLVAKAGKWHLVGKRQDHTIVIAVDRIQTAQFTGKTFQRPADFDLVNYWDNWCREYEENRPRYPVLLRVSSDIFPELLNLFGDITQEIEDPAEEGWTTLKIIFEYYEEAHRNLLRFGGAIEILEPIALRYSIKDYAEQILKVYVEE